MISIPRDVWIPEIRAKINSSYHYGGLSLAKSSTEIALGIPVHYGVLLNFSGFKDIVDVLGGINVEVDNDFVDKLYPIAGKENDPCLICRYETIEFKKGFQTMNGDMALKFVRSRHAEGVEGTDIARETRQQKVIGAIENKLKDPKIFLNIRKDVAIYKVVTKSIETDMNLEAMAILARKTLDSYKSITKYLIPKELLTNPLATYKYDKQYVFIPKLGNGNWEDVHKWAISVLN